MIPVSATPEAQPHNTQGPGPRARAGGGLAGCQVPASGQSAQERSSSPAAPSRDRQPSPVLRLILRRSCTRPTTVEHNFLIQTQGRVGEHDLGILKKPGFKSQVF